MRQCQGVDAGPLRLNVQVRGDGCDQQNQKEQRRDTNGDRASRKTNLVQVGIRSMDESEKQWLDPDKCFFAQEMSRDDAWMDRSIDLLGDKVYLTIDLDVFDPSLMPSTGTPEPGGPEWYLLLTYLKKVFEEKEVVGLDLVEFAPIPSLKAPDFLVAKLYYKLLSYKFQKSHSP